MDASEDPSDEPDELPAVVVTAGGAVVVGSGVCAVVVGSVSPILAVTPETRISRI